MQRLIVISAVLGLATACGGEKTTGGNNNNASPPLELGAVCDPADDRCDTGLLCYDAGAGATCHTRCDASVWPSTCDGATEACAQANACVPALALDASCNPANDLCGANAHCADVTGGSAPVCTPACTGNGGCTSTEACFILGFLTHGTETVRVCAPSLVEGATCDAAQTYCDVDLDCLDAGDGRGAVCWRTCTPDASWQPDWSDCGSDACVPSDYFQGTLDSPAGICTPFVADATTECVPHWDICTDFNSHANVCADLDGDGAFTCTRGCDLLDGGTGCSGSVCVPVARVHEGLDPRRGVCVTTLAVGATCNPDADLCPEFYGCAGDDSLGWACRQHVGGAFGACIGSGDPCLVDDLNNCGTPSPDCVHGCPPITVATSVTLPQVARQGDNDDRFCVRNDNCLAAFEVSGHPTCSAHGGGTCVVFPFDNGVTWENVRTCVPAGAATAGQSCDATTRCAAGLECVSDVFGAAFCRELCDSSLATWPQACTTQTTDVGALICDSLKGCCIDMSCFAANAPSGDFGIFLPDFGTACDIRTQTGCGTGESCMPQAGAWDRGTCQAAAGTAAAGEPCEEDGTGSLGCATGLICLPLGNQQAQCTQICNPVAPTGCTQGAWTSTLNCIDANDLDNSGAPDNTLGLCLPFCTLLTGCDDNQGCFLFGAGNLGLCLDKCDASADGGCAFGSQCLPEPVTDLFQGRVNGTGTCDESGNLPGANLCTAATKNTDCGTADSQCILAAGLPDINGNTTADEGFCALYVGAGETSCNTATGARCPNGQACYEEASGKTFCAPVMPGTPCGGSIGACSGANQVCVPSAPVAGAPNTGFCGRTCVYNASAFPNTNGGTACPPVDSGNPSGPKMACYHVPGGAGSDGFCAAPFMVPGSPRTSCDPNSSFVAGPNGQTLGTVGCNWTVGAPFVCAALGNSAHEPTKKPEGRCVPRCLAGANGDIGTCGGVPTACVADGSPVDGLCLTFSPLEPTCDILTQTGCPPYQTCALGFGPLPPGGLLLSCSSEVGPKQLGEDCDNATVSSQCDVGLLCVSDTAQQRLCMSPCDPDPAALWSCGTGFTCVDISLAYFGSLGQAGLCMPTDSCDLVAQDCEVTETCEPVGFYGPRSSAGQALECVTAAGLRTLGQACDSTNGCAAGGMCTAGLWHPITGVPMSYCAAFCDPTVALNNPKCDAFGGSKVCLDVSEQFNAAANSIGMCDKVP